MIMPGSDPRPARLRAWADALGGTPRGLDGDLAVRGLADDSRTVEEGDLFFARRGHLTNGARFVREALDRGAVAVVAGESLPASTPAIVVEDAAVALRCAADLWYGYPQDHLDLVGVTGTKGKTTAAWLIAAALRHANLPCAVFGTIGHDVGGGAPRREARTTTPGVLELRRLLAGARDAGARAVVMEVSSHALDQGRVDGLAFRAAVFTNLGRDHLDYHGDVESYFEAKSRLFAGLGAEATAVLNRDDARWSALASRCRSRVLTYGTHAHADLRIEDLSLSVEGSRFRVTPAGGLHPSIDVQAHLAGRHNALNLAAAVGTAMALDVDPACAAAGAQALAHVPGRLERVTPAGDLHVFVDYAHTAEALREVLVFLRGVGAQDLTCVVGCGGDRDVTKRPRMARAAAEASTRVLLTSDNPRTEDPLRILRDMEAGVPASLAGRVTTEPDRRAAIARAVREAPPGGTVLVAGKGHETTQIVGTHRIPFDDVEEARRALARRLREVEGETSRAPSRAR